MDQILPNFVLVYLFEKNKIDMPRSNFGDDLDPKFIPKLIPRGPNGDKLGIFLIYGSNWTKFPLSGPF